MNAAILKERIQQVLRSTVLGTGLLSVDTEVTTDSEGRPTLTIDQVTGDAYMDNGLSTVIAEAVAAAVTEFLANDVVVKVENAQPGVATLSGYLE